MTFFHHHPLLLSSLLQLQIRAQPISSSIRTLATLSTATTTPSSSPSSSTPTEPTTSEATIPQSTPSQSPTSITELINPPQKPWMPGLRRTGVLARKRGMTSFWDSDGIRIPVTVLEDPGRVWPGKKMAGRMGNQPVTVRNLLVARIDTDMNLIYVKGQVPGPKKAFVRVTDAEKGVHRVGQHWIRKGWNVHNQALLPGHIKALPFPTIDTRSAANLLPDQISLSALSKLKNTKAVE
ncbi:54S ribosomal protein L9, mitochondrial [Puccinia graminis f. sp. tritici]|uniref:Large ribosomal subunit protein uL3m n=1 Tax=Puccinia graminis f. sp. tritici TaxID=56615 RepID=A0A5B0M4C4_PUCGR|nr:54S ribosomal protein L9, mitochondrial [Puccinia graminis f. sp. tritici]